MEFICPQCSGKIPGVETDRLLHCKSCDSIWQIDQAESVYYIHAQIRETDSLVYIPYWHFRGYFFVINNQSISYQWIDQTIAAVSSPEIPFSLHQQVLNEKLLSISNATEGRFLLPQESQDKCLNKSIHMLDGANLITKTIYDAPSKLENKKKNFLRLSFKEVLSKEENVPVKKYEEADLIHQISSIDFHHMTSREVFSKNDLSKRWIPVSESLIFYPFILRGEKFLNGLTQQEIKQPDDILNRPEYRTEKKTSLKRIACPSCKGSLVILKNTEFLHCPACQKTWIVYQNQLAACGIGMLRSKQEDAYYLPFWKISAQSKGVDRYKSRENAWSYNLDRDSHLTEIISIWIPAFELPPAHMIRAASFLSRIDPVFPLEKFDPEIVKTKNNISLNRAVEIASVLILDMARKDGSYNTTLGDFRIAPKKALFIYVPFMRQGMDLTQPDTNLCIQSPPFLYKQED